MAKPFWRFVRNEDSSFTPAIGGEPGLEPPGGSLYLYGEMGSEGDPWSDVTAGSFADDLKGLGDVKHIDLHVNSAGGDVFAGHAIHSMLAQHPAAVHGFVDGLAASAASIPLMACDTVTMPRNAMMMIHNPNGMTFGDARDHRDTADVLDKVRDSIAATYQSKTGMDRGKILNLMNASTWMTADDAKALGFCDTVTDPVRVTAQAGCRFIANGVGLDLSKMASWPGRFVASAEAGDADPDDPDEPTDDAPELLPLAPRGRKWDASAADERVRKWADAETAPNATYAKAFFAVDGDADNYGSYKLPFADVIDDKLTAVPKGVFSAAGAVDGARGEKVDLPADAEKSAKGRIDAYYAEMRNEFDDDDIKAPWDAGGAQNAAVAGAVGADASGSLAPVDIERARIRSIDELAVAAGVPASDEIVVSAKYVAPITAEAFAVALITSGRFATSEDVRNAALLEERRRAAASARLAVGNGTQVSVEESRASEIQTMVDMVKKARGIV